MANEEPGSVEGVDPQPRRRVPPPTIDLEARDVSAPPPADEPASGAPDGDAKGRSGRRWPLFAAGLVGAGLALGIAAGAWTLLGANVQQQVDHRVEARLTMPAT